MDEIIDLIEKSKSVEASFYEGLRVSGRIEPFEYTTTNEKLGLKAGDIIEFWSGYHNDIRYRTKILGFDNAGKAYMLWDCYWSPVDLEVGYKYSNQTDYKLVVS